MELITKTNAMYRNSGSVYKQRVILTRSVPRSMQRMVIVPRGRGTSARMKSRNGEISGMLLVRVYAMDFFRLSKIRRPTQKPKHNL